MVQMRCSQKVTKQARHHLEALLAKLFQQILCDGVFTVNWKQANACPLIKCSRSELKWRLSPGHSHLFCMQGNGKHHQEGTSKSPVMSTSSIEHLILAEMLDHAHYNPCKRLIAGQLQLFNLLDSLSNAVVQPAGQLVKCSCST